MVALGGVVGIASWIPGCVTPPRNPNDVCSIFAQRHAWYRATLAVEKRWGIDQSTQMAVLFQESSFKASARPPRTKLMGFIPWTRRSTAYGYAQVLDSTWDVYRDDAHKPRAQRDRFPDAADFVGWYMDRVSKHAKISKTNSANLYLAYHEGAGGYSRGTHRKKQWLLNTAARVQKRATQYRAQLTTCRERLDNHRWWWPFS